MGIACGAIVCLYARINVNMLASLNRGHTAVFIKNLWSKMSKKIYGHSFILLGLLLFMFGFPLKGDGRYFSKWLPWEFYFGYTVSITTFYFGLWLKCTCCVFTRIFHYLSGNMPHIERNATCSFQERALLS